MVCILLNEYSIFLHVIIRFFFYIDFIKWMHMFKCEYFLTIMYTCLNAIDVFFYLNPYMCLCISCVEYILILYLDCTLAWYRYAGRRNLEAFLVVFSRCLESFILFWVKLWFCNTRDWGLFLIIILCFGIHYSNSFIFFKTIWRCLNLFSAAIFLITLECFFWMMRKCGTLVCWIVVCILIYKILTIVDLTSKTSY